MNGTKNFNHKLVVLDANIFIYQLQQNPKFGIRTKTIFDHLVEGQLKAVTSVLTLTEILSFRAPSPKLGSLKKLFLGIPNLTIFDVTQEIAFEAAKIRREYGFRTPDAIQLATAIKAKAKVFITNDYRLKSFKKIKVVLI
jgi:predicted nucleic acid-binding protein